MTIKRKIGKKRAKVSSRRKTTKVSRRNPDKSEYIEKNILWPHDGPVTDFVILMRAFEGVEKGNWSAKEAANVVYELLFRSRNDIY